MRRWIVILALCLAAGALPGCAEMTWRSPTFNDPLTGGVDGASSRLLGVQAPAGLQGYPSHGGPGHEVFRGGLSLDAAMGALHGALSAQGWHVRLGQRQGGRAVCVYERGGEMAALVFEATAAGTLVHVWAGGRLPDGAALAVAPAPGAGAADAPVGGGMGAPSDVTETWGGSAVPEHDL